MYTTKGKKGHIKVSLTLTFKVNCQDQVLGFVFSRSLTSRKLKSTPRSCLYYTYNQRYGRSYVVYIYDLSFEGQPSRSRNLFQFFWGPWPQKCQNRHQDQLCVIITSLVMNGQVAESLTSNFKIIRQGHVIYFNIFEFYDLNYVENGTNLIDLSHLDQKISRLTNNGKNSAFWPPSWTFDDMTYVTWQRQDDVTYAQNVSSIPSNIYDEAIFAIGIIKKVTGEKRQGVVPTPLGVRGLRQRQ